jgi:SAM-dependent methyltransferase
MEERCSMGLLAEILRCPDCRGRVSFDDEGWTCVSCGNGGAIDDDGVVHLTDQDFYYREVPRDFFQPILQARSAKDAMRGFAEALSTLPEDKRDAVVRYALKPNRGGAVVLAPVHEGTVTLDYGSGWGTFTRTISHFGGIAISVDMTYESLAFSRKIATNAREVYVRGGRQYPLPFADGSFDSVFLNGVLEWIPEDYMMGENPETVQRKFLREFHRVLKPRGRIVIGIENRNSMMYWSGSREDHTGLIFGALLPRILTNQYSRIVRGRPYRTYTYTKYGYRRLLSESGFSSVQFFYPWLRYRYWNRMYTEKGIDAEPVVEAKPSDSPMRRRAIALVRLMRASRILSWFVPDFYIMAQKGGDSDDGRPASVLEIIAGKEGDRVEDILTLKVSSTHTLRFRSHARYYKVPLTTQADARLQAEVKALSALRGRAVERFLVDFSAYRVVKGVAYAVFSAIPRRDTRPQEEVEVKFQAAKDLLRETGRDARDAEVQATNMWNRIVDPEFVRFLSRFVSEASLGGFLERVATKRVPSGMVHGDLCSQNVIVSRRGRPVVVDWDMFEEFSPGFLDPAHWCINFLSAQQGESLGSVLRRLADGRESQGLAQPMWELAGGLSRQELLLLYLLDRVAKDRTGVPDPVYLPSQWHRDVGRAFVVCEGWMD